MDDVRSAIAEKRRLTEAKAKQETVLAAIGEGVVVVSDKGGVMFINRQALSVLQMGSEDLIGKHLISTK